MNITHIMPDINALRERDTRIANPTLLQLQYLRRTLGITIEVGTESAHNSLHSKTRTGTPKV